MPQHSLDKVSIDGFRALRKLTLDGLGPINILVGENNSGKTSVLEALSILCNPYDPYQWLAMVRRRDFGGLDETRIHSLRWCFPQTGELANPEFMFESQCEMRCAGTFPLRTLRVDYTDILGEPSARDLERLTRQRPGTGDPIDEQWRGAEIVHHVESDSAPQQANLFDSSTNSTNESIAIQLWEDDRLVGRTHRPHQKGNLPTGILTPYSYQINSMQVRSHSQHLFATIPESTKGKGYVLDLIRMFDPEIEDIAIGSFRGARPAIYLNHKQMGPAPLSIFGDGLRRAVLIASTLHALKGGGILMIDEVETGIHVSALQRVFAWLAKAASEFAVQVVVTTHSLEAVDAMMASVGDQIGDVVTYHLQQSQEETSAKRIAGDVLKRLRFDRGIDVR